MNVAYRSNREEKLQTGTIQNHGNEAADLFEPLLNDIQAAKLLGDMHPKTLQRIARNGQIPAHKIGRFWYFRASELNSWINNSCTPFTSDLPSAHRPCLVN